MDLEKHLASSQGSGKYQLSDELDFLRITGVIYSYTRVAH